MKRFTVTSFAALAALTMAACAEKTETPEFGAGQQGVRPAVSPSAEVPAALAASLKESFAADIDEGWDADAYGTCVLDNLVIAGADLEEVESLMAAAEEEGSIDLYSSTIGEARLAAEFSLAMAPCMTAQTVATYRALLDDDIAQVASFATAPESYGECLVDNNSLYSSTEEYLVSMMQPVADAPVSADDMMVEDYMTQLSEQETEDSVTDLLDSAFSSPDDESCGGFAAEVLEKVVSEIEVVDQNTLKFTFAGDTAAVDATLSAVAEPGSFSVSFGGSAPPGFSVGDESGTYTFEEHGFLGGGKALVSFGTNGMLAAEMTLTGVESVPAALPEDVCSDTGLRRELVLADNGENSYSGRHGRILVLDCSGATPAERLEVSDVAELAGVVGDGDRVAIENSWGDFETHYVVKASSLPVVNLQKSTPPADAVLLEEATIYLRKANTELQVDYPLSFIAANSSLSEEELLDDSERELTPSFTILTDNGQVSRFSGGSETMLGERTQNEYFREFGTGGNAIVDLSQTDVLYFRVDIVDTTDSFTPEDLSASFYVKVPVEK